MQDKGRRYFAGEGELGNNFVRINLETIKMLASKFPKGKNEDLTMFKKIYNKLLEEKVTFPSDFKFYTSILAKSHRDDPMKDSKQ